MRSTLAFLGGLAVGAAVGFVSCKIYLEKKYSDRAEEQINEMEQYYKKVDEYARVSSDDDQNDEEEQSKGRESGPMTREERRAAKDQMFRNREKNASPTDYTKYYNVGDADPAEMEHPEDDQNDEDESEIVTPEEIAFDEHRKNMNKPPRIISAETYSNLPPHIDQECLLFYAYDEMLCDENEEPILIPEQLVGDALTKYGFVDNDEIVIYVMNYALDTCYEIRKLEQSWTDTH